MRSCVRLRSQNNVRRVSRDETWESWAQPPRFYTQTISQEKAHTVAEVILHHSQMRPEAQRTDWEHSSPRSLCTMTKCDAEKGRHRHTRRCSERDREHGVGGSLVLSFVIQCHHQPSTFAGARRSCEVRWFHFKRRKTGTMGASVGFIKICFLHSKIYTSKNV